MPPRPRPIPYLALSESANSSNARKTASGDMSSGKPPSSSIVYGRRVLYEYVISEQNDCIVCSTYFRKLFKETGVDLETFEPTEDEALLIEFAKALADDPMHVPAELKDRMQARWDDHDFVTIVAQGLMMLANNYYNEIMEVDV